MVTLKFVDNRATFQLYRNGRQYQCKQRMDESFVEFQERIKITNPEFYNDINWSGETIPKIEKQKKVRISTPRKFDIQLWKDRFPELDFSEFVYKTGADKSVLKCSKHGKFLNSINNLNQMYMRTGGNGCPKCSKEKTNNRINKLCAGPNLWKMNAFLKRSLG